MDIPGYFLLIFHALFCILLLILDRFGLLKSGKKLFVIACLVPVWGAVCLLLQEHSLCRSPNRRRESGIERLKINDEIYRSILTDEEETSKNLIPFEDALVINDAKLRRELVMDIMYSDPSQYVDLLRQARMDEDTEVVHYAATAMVELQKGYDAALKAEEVKYKQEPESIERIREYASLIEDYIESGLLEGNMLAASRRRYSQLLERFLSLRPDEKRFWRKKGENDIALKEYEAAADCIDELLTRWPEEEDGYLLEIQYEAVRGSREGIDRILERLKQAEIPLSAAGKDIIKFWMEGVPDEERVD